MVTNNFFTDKVNIFWTGGYDSTFRLCQLLIEYKVKVQPIYISDPYLDNYKSSRVRRNNHKEELDTMVKLRKKIFSQFPFTKNLLLPVLIIKEVKIDDNTKHHMKNLYKMKYVRREHCQYGGMAQVTKKLNTYIELCAEIGGFLHKNLHKKLKCYGKSCKYRECIVKDNKDLQPYDHSLKIFNKLVFPVISYTKKDMYVIAKNHKFDNILNMSWSCWYPRNNKPCGRCIMCRERFVDYNTIEGFSNKNLINFNKIISIILVITILHFYL
jgi:hypothetical protein